MFAVAAECVENPMSSSHPLPRLTASLLRATGKLLPESVPKFSLPCPPRHSGSFAENRSAPFLKQVLKQDDRSHCGGTGSRSLKRRANSVNQSSRSTEIRGIPPGRLADFADSPRPLATRWGKLINWRPSSLLNPENVTSAIFLMAERQPVDVPALPHRLRPEMRGRDFLHFDHPAVRWKHDA